jgi:hypothetical protein
MAKDIARQWIRDKSPAKALKCARCGEVRAEHSYDGACYGKCGRFIEPGEYVPPERVENTIFIIQQNPTGGPRHGGWRTYRHFIVYINGYEVTRFDDDSPATNYDSDKYLDERIETWLNKMATALHCRPIRGKIKGFDPNNGLQPANYGKLSKVLR